MAKQKLGKGWVGPYRVVSCPTNIHYDITKLSEDRIVRVHVDQLKPHLGPNPEGWSNSEQSTQESDGGDNNESSLGEGSSSDSESVNDPSDQEPEQNLNTSSQPIVPNENSQLERRSCQSR